MKKFRLSVISSLIILGFQVITPAENTFIVDSTDTVINSYASVGKDLISETNQINLSDESITNLNKPAFLKKGDLLMIIQMQGSLIEHSDTKNYGNILDYNNSGIYEFVTVKNILGNSISLTKPLKNNYKALGNTQIIKVPEYNSMSITKQGILSAMPWNGKTGGIIAVKVKNSIFLNGLINASGKGFRGGQKDSKTPVNGIYKYFSSNSGEGGEKGESIVGYKESYDSLGGRYGRGAPANGGGGGNSHNAPGGGGANADNGNIWTGYGVMCSACEGSSAWILDPGYLVNNSTTMSSGGGRGGYSYSANNIDELLSAPESSLWGGDNRREVGGIGGRPLNNNSDQKMFFGGGGGAGQANNNAGGSGGNGGGIIYIISEQISGTGSINSNGNNGEDSHKINFGDAPGGGGGGGSIVLKSNSVSGITINARGGSGGNQYIGDIPEAEGGGGGGGGGYVHISSLGATISVNGGPGGVTDSVSMTKFANNGSTDGGTGYLDISTK